MNEHRFPRLITIGLIALIVLTLLAGTLRAFAPARAVSAAPGRALSGAAVLAPTATRSGTPAGRIPTPTPTPTATPAPAPTPAFRSADTSGIIGMSVLMVAIVLFGVLWGARKPGRKKERPPKPVKPKKDKTRPKKEKARKK